jgi:membrane protein required for colicin V production
VQPLVKELPVVGEFLSDSCELSVVAAFAGVFVDRPDRRGALHAAVFSGAVQRSALGGIDQALGFLFGACARRPADRHRLHRLRPRAVDQPIPMIDNSAAPRTSSRTSRARSTATSRPMRRAGSSNATTT